MTNDMTNSNVMNIENTETTLLTTDIVNILEHQLLCPDNNINSYGQSVSMNNSGNRVIVGAYRYNSNQGKVYIYTKSNDNWLLETEIICPEDGNNHFGISLSMNDTGDKVVIGSPEYKFGLGKAYIYERFNNNWSLKQELICSDNGNNQFGRSVCMNGNGNRIIVGAYGYNSDQGKVYIYVKSDNNWILEKEIVCPDNGVNCYGYSVAMNSTGDIAVIGADIHNSSLGKVYIYTKTDDDWILEQEIIHPDDESNHFGCSISINSVGDRIVIGAYNSGFGQNKVYVYKKTDGNWILEQDITCPDGKHNYFGHSVSINNNGDKIIVGGYGYNFGKGKIYVYTRSNDSWLLKNQITSYDDGSNFFGCSTSMNSDGSKFVIGAHRYNSNQGKVYIYA